MKVLKKIFMVLLIALLIAGACFGMYKKPWTISQGNITSNDVIIRCDKDIESINTQIDSLNKSIFMLQEQKTSQNTKINENTAKLNELDVKSDNYAEQQEAIQNQINSLQTSVNELDMQITTLQSQVTTLESYVSTIELLQAEVLELKENQTATTDNLTELNNRLVAIENKMQSFNYEVITLTPNSTYVSSYEYALCIKVGNIVLLHIGSVKINNLPGDVNDNHTVLFSGACAPIEGPYTFFIQSPAGGNTIRCAITGNGDIITWWPLTTSINEGMANFTYITNNPM